METSLAFVVTVFVVLTAADLLFSPPRKAGGGC